MFEIINIFIMCFVFMLPNGDYRLRLRTTTFTTASCGAKERATKACRPDAENKGGAMSQHLHNRIGNAIGEAKRRLLDRLKTDTDIEAAVTLFLSELKLELDRVVAAVKNVSS